MEAILSWQTGGILENFLQEVAVQIIEGLRVWWGS